MKVLVIIFKTIFSAVVFCDNFLYKIDEKIDVHAVKSFFVYANAVDIFAVDV